MMIMILLKTMIEIRMMMLTVMVMIVVMMNHEENRDNGYNSNDSDDHGLIALMQHKSLTKVLLVDCYHKQSECRQLY